jgi:hypothetical protein
MKDWEVAKIKNDNSYAYRPTGVSPGIPSGNI